MNVSRTAAFALLVAACDGSDGEPAPSSAQTDAASSSIVAGSGGDPSTGVAAVGAGGESSTLATTTASGSGGGGNGESGGGDAAGGGSSVGGGDGGGSSILVPWTPQEAELLLGSDRVGRVLLADAQLLPGTLAEVELAFGIGRHCEAVEGREIFLIEEHQVRPEGIPAHAAEPVPRFVFGGCGGDPDHPSDARSADLFAVLLSDPGADEPDPLDETIIELMGLDDQTGVYNFYELRRDEETGRGTVTRIVEGADGTVTRLVKRPTASLQVETAATRACFSCHPHGAPLMNELRSPWPNWLSSERPLPARAYGGETADLIGAGTGDDGSPSNAGDLQTLIEIGSTLSLRGNGSPQHGHLSRVSAGLAPGGARRLLRSVLCDSEVSWERVGETVPLGVFLDGDAVAGSGLGRPLLSAPVAGGLTPVRGDIDRRIESALVQRGYLSPELVTAARLVDDQHDVFSEARCSVLDLIAQDVQLDDFSAALRSALLASMPADEQPARAAYRLGLLAEPPEVGSELRTAYWEEATARLTAAVAASGDGPGRALLLEELSRRLDGAIALFPDSEHPRPRYDVAPID